MKRLKKTKIVKIIIISIVFSKLIRIFASGKERDRMGVATHLTRPFYRTCLGFPFFHFFEMGARIY